MALGDVGRPGREVLERKVSKDVAAYGGGWRLCLGETPPVYMLPGNWIACWPGVAPACGEELLARVVRGMSNHVARPRLFPGDAVPD
jgi:hypothetical protein